MGEDAAADNRFAGAYVLLRRADSDTAAKSSSAPRSPILTPSLWRCVPATSAPGRSPTLCKPAQTTRREGVTRSLLGRLTTTDRIVQGGDPACFYFERPRAVDRTGSVLAKEIALKATVILAKATIEANGDHAPR